jgi:phosphate transport system substrate-binding protein
MYKVAKDPSHSKAALDFFRWALTEGQKQATAIDYVPLPPALVTQVEAYWKPSFAPLN